MKRFKAILWIRLILFVLVFIFFLFNFLKTEVNTYNIPRGNVVFVVDVSNSMNVKDVYFKGHLVSRLTLAKKLIENAVKNYDNKYGLILISNKMEYLVPPTFDKDIFLTYLDTINTNLLDGGKFNFEKSINEVSKVLDYQDIAVILSDFDFNFNSKNIKFHNYSYLIGIGSKQGDIVRDRSGKKISINGKFLKSSLNEQTIKKLAEYLNGKYEILSNFSNKDDVNLGKILDQVSKKMNGKNNKKSNLGDIISSILILFSL